ncbi:hypothetical protein [Sphaerisporangium album]|uniref:hypothetical protein n=1 Tax=Sphaerisporangium album TaxID=509200 RepID=UPI0011C02243|nr:hypothetical protein [Sphaerisporangium album]
MTTENYVKDGDVRHDRWRITAGRCETYGQLFPLDDIMAAYRRALPADLAEREVEALQAHRDVPVARYVPRPADLLDAKRSLSGLTLGHPVEITVMGILRAAGRREPAVPPRCHHDGPHMRLRAMPSEIAVNLLAFVRRHWAEEFSGATVDSVEDLVRRDYVLEVAYRRHLGTPGHQFAGCLDVEAHQYLCCLLRGNGREPQELHYDSVKSGRDGFAA